MRTIRVFISSPSDAMHERNRVSRAAARLNNRYQSILRFEIVRWEDDFYKAHQTFQTQIREARDCDIVIGVLKHRLGTPLPEDFPRMPEMPPFNGERYPSGTAYEILSSIAARLMSREESPDVYVLRDAEPPRISLGARDAEQVTEQWHRLETFVRRYFFTETGEFRFAIDTYSSTDAFEARIEALLEKWVADHVRGDERITWPIAVKGSPFRGLDVFDFAHRDVFFGRSRETERALSMIASLCDADDSRPAFLLVLGPSGSGKSSLLRAGLVPTILQADIGNADEWRVAVMKPSEGASPFEALALALSGNRGEQDAGTASTADQPRALPELAVGAFANPQSLTALLAAGGLAAASAIEAALDAAERQLSARDDFTRPARIRLLLVVDQLDDLFSGAVSDADRDRFTELLRVLATGDRIAVAASLRAGLYEQVLNDATLSALRQQGAMLELASPGTAELAEIVRRPAAAAGLVFEQDPATGQRLDEKLLADFDRPDMLPLLQFALERLFVDRREIGGHTTLTIASYEAMNGIAGAVAAVADQALAGLDAAARSKLPKLLRLLVQRSPGTSDGETAFSLTEAPAILISNDPPLAELAGALTAARLIVECRTKTGQPAFRLSHQRLLTIWPEAAKAVEDNAFFFRVNTELNEALARFLRNGGRFSGVIRDPVLLAETVRLKREYGDELSPAATSLIGRSRLRARLGAIGLMTAVAGFAGLSVAAFVSYQQSERNFGLAVSTLDGVVSDIADGLRNVTGMTIENRLRILGRVQETVDALEAQAGASDRFAVTRWRMLVVNGDSQAAGGNGETAETLYREALGLAESATASNPADATWQRNLSVNLERLGDLVLKQGDRAGAEALYERSITASRALMSVLDEAVAGPDLAISIDRFTRLKTGSGDFKGALAAAEEALAIRRKLAASYPDDRWNRDIASSLQTIAEIENGLGDSDAARARIEEALQLSRQLTQSDPGNADYASTLFSALNMEADALADADRRADAAAIIEEALRLARQMIASDPGNATWQEHLANALERQGNYALFDKRLDEARRAYEEIVSMARALSATDPANLDYRNQLAIGTMRLADVTLEAGQTTEAKELLEEALAIRKAILESDPHNIRMLETLNTVEMRLGNLAERQANPQEALRHHIAAIQSARSLTAASPDTPDYRIRLLTRLVKAGDAKIALGQPKDAVQFLEEALPLARSIAASGRSSDRRDLTVILDKLGEAERLSNAPQAAATYASESVSISRQLLSETPSDPDRQSDLVRGLALQYKAEEAAGRHPAALANLQEATQLSFDMLTRNPADAANWDLALEASKEFVMLAGEDPEAKPTAVALRREIIEKVLSLKPDNPDRLLDMAEVSGQLAEATDDAAERERLLRQSLAAAQKRAALMPSDAEVQRLSAQRGDKLAEHLLAQGRFADALTLFVSGREIAATLSAAAPENDIYRRDILVSDLYAGAAATQKGDKTAAAAYFADAVGHARILSEHSDPGEAGPRLELVRALYNHAEATTGVLRLDALTDARAVLAELQQSGLLAEDKKGWIGEIDAMIAAEPKP